MVSPVQGTNQNNAVSPDASSQGAHASRDAVTQRVLIVRPSALGDVARTVPALVTLRRAFPEACIDWLVNRGFDGAIQHHPDLDGVVLFDRARWRASYGLAKQLRSQRYTHVYDLQGLLRSGFFTRVTAAAHRVGFANARELGWLGYPRSSRYHVSAQMHAVDRMLELLKADGLTPVRDLRLYSGEADRTKVLDALQQADVQPGRYAVLAPTAKWRCKRWPAANYVEIGRRLLEGRDAVDGVDGLVILVGPGEHDEARRIVDALPAPLQQRVMLPTTTVAQMLAWIQHSALVVCNDSAAAHIAVGFDRPLVCVFGPTDPDLTGPCDRRDSVVQPHGITAQDMQGYRSRKDDDALIAQVTVDQAWETLLRELEAARQRTERL